MAKTTANVQAEAGKPAPQTNPDNSGAADGSGIEGMSALEVQALAGDEASRRALGLPTATLLAGPGEPADADVYEDLDGNLTSEPGDGFRGSRIAIKGQPVDAATAARIARG